MKESYLKFSNYLIFSLILTIVGAAVGSQMNPSYIKGFALLGFVIIIAFMFAKGALKKILFILFCFGEGFVLAPIVHYYSETDLVGCLILTMLITITMIIVGYKAKNLSFMGNILLILLFGLCFYSIIGIFFNLPSIALLGVLLFSAYIAYDINNFKRVAISRRLSSDEILNYVMDLYLDILNLFLQLLKLLGKDE